MRVRSNNKPRIILRSEWPLAITLATMLLFLMFGQTWLTDLSARPWFAFMLMWLFTLMLVSAFAVVRHAEGLAVELGEPLGTLVLTLSVTGIEVILITATMFAGDGSPTLARDAMFAVVMIVLNGMVGLTLLLGGLRYHEQAYNLQGANSFLAVILPLAVLGLVLPNFTKASPGPTFSPLQAMFLIAMSIALYSVFLALQNLLHRSYFMPAASSATEPNQDAAIDSKHKLHSTPYHALLLAYFVPLAILGKQIGVPIDYGIRVLGAPDALGGLLVAVLVARPRISECRAGGACERAAAFGEYLAGLGACNHWAHHPGGACHRAHHRQKHRSRSRCKGDRHVGVDLGVEHAHLHQPPHQCSTRRGAYVGVSRLLDANFR